MRAACLTFLVVLSFSSKGQEMLLTQGTLYIHPGTVLEIHGMVDWNVLSDAQVVNDGRVEFHEEAYLIEVPGSPFVGTGTEHAWVVTSMPLSVHQPGGLGLELTSQAPIGPFEIVRGHQPFILDNDQESVNRWFRIPEGLPIELDQMIFRFDDTELNGLNAAQLDLHDADQVPGTWVPMLAEVGNDLLSLAANDATPREYITAFHLDAATAVDQLELARTFQVWPTISSGTVNVGSAEGERISRLEVFDMHGRSLPVNVIGGLGSTAAIIDISTYRNAPLLLRVNGGYTFKLVKE